MRRRPSALYYMSWLIIAIILLLAVFGGMLKPKGISEADRIEYRQHQIEGKTRYETPPFPPDSNFLLGTDHRGFDLLSLLLNGLKYTLAIIITLTTLRILFAIPWGLWVGVSGKGFRLLRSMNFVVSSAPAFLFVYPPLATLYFGLGMDTVGEANGYSVMLFNVLYFIMFTIFGVIPLAYQMAERAQYYNDKQYVEISRIMGGSLLHRMVRHILPNMRLELLFAGLSEFVQVTFLMGQLAVFKIMIGGTDLLQWGDPEPESMNGSVELFYIPRSGEWSSMLAYGLNYVRLYPWIMISVAAGLFLLILSVQMLINQLKKRFRGENEQLNL
jgi:peptide/nickel transport system permease protein